MTVNVGTARDKARTEEVGFYMNTNRLLAEKGVSMEELVEVLGHEYGNLEPGATQDQMAIALGVKGFLIGWEAAGMVK